MRRVNLEVCKRLLREANSGSLWPILGWGLFIVVAAALLVAVAWKVPDWLHTASTLECKDRIDAENEILKTIAQILGGGALLVGLYLTWRRIKATEEGQITERFTRAIEHLGSGKQEVELGGIYALERIAGDSRRDHGPIVEVLTAFIRERAPWEEEHKDTIPKKVLPEIQAALTVLARRKWTYGKGETQPLDLQATNLRGALLQEAHFERAQLRGAHLENANLGRAHLERAFLRSAHLERAHLLEAHLQEVDFNDAHLEEADLLGAHLQGADLRFAHLKQACLFRAHLEGAQLFGAHLEGANLTYAHLQGATLKGACMQGTRLKETDLSGAKDLTQQQINQARGDKDTKLPQGLEAPTHWLDLEP